MVDRHESDGAMAAAPLPTRERGTPTDAVATPSGVTAKARPFKRIGIGRPLLVSIESIYLGPGKARKDVLVTSRVKDPLLSPAGVSSMNMVKYRTEEREIIDVGTGVGSQVVYYSPAVSEGLLNMSVDLSFDGFDAKRVSAWIDTAADAASLPAFIAGGALAGPVGGAAGQAIVRAAQGAAGVLIDLVDRVVDADGRESLDWEMRIDWAGFVPAQAGWVILYPSTTKGGPPSGMWGSGFTSTQATTSTSEPLVVDGEEYFVDDNGLLHEKKHPREPFRGDFPYALVSANGLEVPRLKRWKPTAVTAALAARFLRDQSGKKIMGDVAQAFEAFSDVLILRQAKSVSKELESAGKDAKKKAALQKQLDALIDSIQDEDLQAAAKGS